MGTRDDNHEPYMRHALRLAGKAYGRTSPNPLVGALLVRNGRIVGQGWHHRAGEPHAEIEALNDARAKGHRVTGATLYVTLEPCSTFGRTPPCTDAIRAAGITRLVGGATDPNPAHRGKGYRILRRAGIEVISGVLEPEATRLNEAFNHWIAQRTPFVHLKAAMTLDGRIATASGESQWITGPEARGYTMKLRQGADAILVGIKTVLRDDPRLTVRWSAAQSQRHALKDLRRIIVDSEARTPLSAQVVADNQARMTTVVVTRSAPAKRVAALQRRVAVWVAPRRAGRLDLQWVLNRLGAEGVTQLLVEGGGEINAAFVAARLVQRVTFFYAPLILGGTEAIRAVAGTGVRNLAEALQLRELEWRRIGEDLMTTARVQ